MIYTNIEEAQLALAQAEQDVALDMGEDAVEQAYRDIVMSVAENCSPGVATELIRRNL